tara:strand:- start:478 stop:663 length:186 start_codon:yes stop_codon:yes gene_type:complete
MEEVKEELEKLIKSINNCNEWSSDLEKAKEFKKNTIDEFVNFRSSDYKNTLYRLVRELEGK